MHQRSCLPGILTSRDLFAVPLAAVRIPLGLERYHREAKVVFTNATTASDRLFTRRHVLIMLDREGSFNSKTTNCSSLLFLFDPLYLSRSLSLLFSPSSFFLILLSCLLFLTFLYLLFLIFLSSLLIFLSLFFLYFSFFSSYFSLSCPLFISFLSSSLSPRSFHSFPSSLLLLLLLLLFLILPITPSLAFLSHTEILLDRALKGHYLKSYIIPAGSAKPGAMRQHAATSGSSCKDGY